MTNLSSATVCSGVKWHLLRYTPQLTFTKQEQRQNGRRESNHVSGLHQIYLHLQRFIPGSQCGFSNKLSNVCTGTSACDTFFVSLQCRHGRATATPQSNLWSCQERGQKVWHKDLMAKFQRIMQ